MIVFSPRGPMIQGVGRSVGRSLFKLSDLHIHLLVA